MCKEYNGYPNYQTWNVSLWLDNEESTYNYVREVAGESDRWDDEWEFADWLKEFTEEANPLSSDASVYSDLLGHALSNVDYYEIADNILSEFDD